MAAANSDVLTSVAPSMRRAKSYVTILSAMVDSSAWTMSSAASCQPRCSNIITPERITDPGFTLSCPAYFGAVPCVASNTPCPVT